MCISDRSPPKEMPSLTRNRHHEGMLMLLEGELYKAPIEEPHRILDIGTGTGLWAIDMADKYSSTNQPTFLHPPTSLTHFFFSRFPMAEVIGTDLRCVCQTLVRGIEC